MKRFYKYAAVVMAVVMIAIAAVGCANTKDKVTVRVNEVTRSVFYAPQYAAIAKGFFEEEGIKVELTTSQGADQVMAATLSGGADIGFAGPEAAIYVYNEGRDNYCKVIAQLTKRDGSFLISREKDDNFNWEKLRGKTILPGRKGGVPYMTLEYVLKSKGLVPGEDLIFDNSIQFALLAGAFTAGTGDYVALFEPTATTLEKESVGYIVASVGEEAGEIPYTVYFASGSYLEKNAETVQKFVNGVYKGLLWVKENSAETVAEAIADFFPDSDMELLIAVVQRYKDIDAWNDSPFMKEEAFDKLQNVIEQAGELEKRAPYDKVVDNSFAEKSIEQIKR